MYKRQDVELVRPLDRLLTNKAFLGFEGTQWVGTNLIGAEPSHSFFIELLKSYDHRCFITPDGKPDQTTNVEELTRKLEKVYGFRKDGSFQQLGDITLYPTDYFCPYDYICLLYTSDAADDLLCVDLGGRRIIKKKKHYNIRQ